MKKTFALLFIAFSFGAAKAQIYMGESSKVSFFSKTAMEDIDAANTSNKPILDAKNSKIIYKLDNVGFKFKSALMEEHFNENYMESEKYPKSTFTGTFAEKVDYTKDGVTKVTVNGTMDMHGVTNNVTVPGTITVKDGKVMIDAKFMIKLADYKIKIPSVVGANVAEAVEVTVAATLAPYKK